MLPPSFAPRVWRQKGFFSWETVPPENWDDPITISMIGRVPEFNSKTTNYHHVNFEASATDIAWARRTVRSLYKEDKTLRLSGLTAWCLETASRGHKLRWQSARLMNADDFVRECQHYKRRIPHLFKTGICHDEAGERVSEMMDYIEMAALRRHPNSGRLAYYIPALLTLTCGLPWSSFPLRPGVTAAVADTRARVFGSGPERNVDEWRRRLTLHECSRPDYDLSGSLFVEREAE